MRSKLLQDCKHQNSLELTDMLELYQIVQLVMKKVLIDYIRDFYITNALIDIIKGR
jgi:hypothetical protein